MSVQKEVSRKSNKRINWNKFTNFRYRKTRDDLRKLISGRNNNEINELLNSHDETGLCPIHWASIHNRSDLIDYMISKGASVRIRCRNKLLAEGSALHLAAMNGSIEAADKLLERCQIEDQSKLKTLTLQNTSTVNNPQIDTASIWLRERDAEGQTALMRSASPQTKRLAKVRDLLRKNFWSLSGRPAEVALFFINKGADWYERDSKYGMNLLHLAIINNYSDIVNLLLVIDCSLALTVVEVPQQTKTLIETNQATVGPTENQPTTSDASSKSLLSEQEESTKLDINKPLLPQDRFDTLIRTNALTPLKLAIVYGRLTIINLIWHTNNSINNNNVDSYESKMKNLKEDREEVKKSESEIRAKKEEYRNILLRAFLSNANEIIKLIRTSSLRFLLAADLIVLTLVWMPVYLANGQTSETNVLLSARSGAFITCYCITLALAFRVMLKNPGYLKRHSIQYLRELVQIVGPERLKDLHSRTVPKPSSNTSNPTTQINLEAAMNQTQQTSELPKILNTNNKDNNHISKMRITDRVRLLCHKCRCIRKARSRHCNYCDHCVQDFDHHCAYLGCCIGRKNRVDFWLMLLMLTLTSTYGTILHTSLLKREEWNNVWHFVGFIWIFKYVLIGFFSSFFMLRRACLGITMFESIRSRRILSIFGPDGPPKSISKSHSLYSIERDSFWRHSPDPFLTGDFSMKQIISNLNEFNNFTSFGDYFLSVACADTALAKSLTKTDNKSTKVELYKLV